MTAVLNGLQDSEVHPSGKLVAAALGDCANIKHGGVAFPSVATLSRMASISESQVRVHLRVLEGRGWITREGPGKGGRAQATRYRLNVPRMESIATAKATAHRRVKGNGPPLGNSEQTRRSAAHKPDGAATQTRRSTVAELEVNGNLNRKVSRTSISGSEFTRVGASIDPDRETWIWKELQTQGIQINAGSFQLRRWLDAYTDAELLTAARRAAEHRAAPIPPAYLDKVLGDPSWRASDKARDLLAKLGIAPNWADSDDGICRAAAALCMTSATRLRTLECVRQIRAELHRRTAEKNGR